MALLRTFDDSVYPATTHTAVRIPVADVMESNCRALFEYWDGLRGQRLAPSWPEFRLDHLDPKVIPFIRVVDILADPFDIRYRYWGTGLVRVLGSERTGQTLSSLPLSRVPQAIREYKAVTEQKAPFAIIYNATTSNGSLPLIVPALRLPLMNDGVTVDKVVAYADFDADQEKWRRLLAERGKETPTTK